MTHTGMRGTAGSSMLALGLTLLMPQPLNAAAPARVAAETKPALVTVYADQASVTRTGIADLPQGESVVVISGLPANLIADSLRVKGRSNGKVTIGSVDVVIKFTTSEEANKRLAALQAQLRDIGDQIAAIDARIAGFKAQQRMIDGIALSFGDDGPVPMSDPRIPPGGARRQPSRLPGNPESWKAAWGAVRDGATDAAEALRKAGIERRGLEERQTAIQNDINAGGGDNGGGSSLRNVEVAVHSEQAAQLRIELHYDLPGAGWEPVYEARLNSVSGQMDLREEAMVTQSTGEDWKDVKLTLSTVRPSGNLSPPAVSTWTISLEPPIMQPLMAKAMDARVVNAPQAPRAMMQSFAAATPPPPSPYIPPPEAQINTAAVSGSAFSVDYAIPGVSTVRGDNTPQKVQIDDIQTTSKLSILTTPALDQRAYIEAKVVNTARHPFLPGDASLFLDDNFVGKTRLPTLRTGEEATVPVGVDDKIKVSYQPDPQAKSTEGFISHANVIKRSASITIANRHDTPIAITVLGQLPVSEDKDLTVILDADPKPTTDAYEQKQGVVAWTATYQPGETQKIHFGYTVTAPTDKIVQGLGE